MSSEPSNKAAKIPVSEGVQETDPKYSDAEVMEALYQEDSEAVLFLLGRFSDHKKEPPGKELGKDFHSKTRKYREEVIQAASNLVHLEQAIKGAHKVGRNNRGNDLEPGIKKYRWKKGGYLETVGR